MDLKEIEEMYALEKDHWWFNGKRQLIYQFLDKNHSGYILDAGCGTGFNLLNFDKEKIIGVDVSYEALKFCKKRGAKLLVQCTVEHLPFKEGVFENILTNDLLEHVTDDTMPLKEFKRTLKNKGVVSISVPVFRFLWTKHDEIFQHKRRYSSKELKNKILKTGFTIEKFSYWNFALFPMVLLYKFLNPKSHIQPANPLLNRALLLFLELDNILIKYMALPFGVSLFCLARKKD